MLAEYGRLSLAQVLAPAIELADGYPIDAETANNIERWKDTLRKWPYSKAVMLPHAGEAREAPQAGEIFRQADLAATLRKLVRGRASRRSPPASRARRRSKPRTTASTGATSRRSSYAGLREQGGLVTLEDLARWKPWIEEPLTTSYRGVDVYKLDTWTQGPVLLQALNILENFDLRAMGYNSANYIHTRLPGDEPRLRRPRLLLRRPAVSAGGAAARTAVEGLREGARGDDSHGPQRCRRRAG